MQRDKALHFAAGLTISLLIGFLFWNPIVGFAVAATVGIAKEVKDEYVYGGFDALDLLSTGLGGLTGALIFILTNQ